MNANQSKHRPWLWDYSTQLAGRWGKADNEYFVSLTFLGLNTVWENVVHLPFSLYSQFVVEAKHGFNKQTVGDFFLGALPYRIGCRLDVDLVDQRRRHPHLPDQPAPPTYWTQTNSRPSSCRRSWAGPSSPWSST